MCEEEYGNCGERIVCGKCGVNGHRTQICKSRVNGSESRAGVRTSNQVEPSQEN